MDTGGESVQFAAETEVTGPGRVRERGDPLPSPASTRRKQSPRRQKSPRADSFCHLTNERSAGRARFALSRSFHPPQISSQCYTRANIHRYTHQSAHTHTCMCGHACIHARVHINMLALSPSSCFNIRSLKKSK